MKLLTRLRELRNVDSTENINVNSQLNKLTQTSSEIALGLHQRNTGFYRTQLDAEYMGVGALTVSDIKRIRSEFN